MSMYQSQRIRRKKPRKVVRWLTLAALLLVLGAGAAAFALLKHSPPRVVSSAKKQDAPVQQPKEQPKPSLVDLQPTVDQWLTKQPADYGIVIYDPANQKVIAAHNADKKYFAASLYKLFVAYLALVDFQNGAQNSDEVLTEGFTRRQCVDKMIRESYSPCGEAMMAAMGQETLRARVSAMGISNTTFAGITTTAQDSALILQYIQEKRDLNAANTAFLKDAMRVQDQRFRRGLAKGAPEATWETKVGWNEQYNYHDVGIMTLPGGRAYIVAILSQNNGSPVPIADFAATIYAVLKQS